MLQNNENSKVYYKASFWISLVLVLCILWGISDYYFFSRIVNNYTYTKNGKQYRVIVLQTNP